jgi:lysosomal Pro-X carboxypeptidase
MLYLSSEQALADYVALITDLKTKLSAESAPVVVFGGSYGGMLATWFRLKYPYIATGAIASSAPILMSDPSLGYAYNDVIAEDFRLASESCYQSFKTALLTISYITTQEGLHNLSVNLDYLAT